MASGRAGALTRGARDHPVGATRRGGHVAEPQVARAWLSGAQGVRQCGKLPRNIAPRGRPCGASRGPIIEEKDDS